MVLSSKSLKLFGEIKTSILIFITLANYIVKEDLRLKTKL